MGLRYNPALDGLRAVSILLVVAAHSAVPGLAGGGRGVDVFFVLSGYLITTIISADLKAGTFSRSDFWLRRLRRLMPALTLMVGAYVLLAPLLLPEFAVRRWQDGAAALLYVTDYVAPLSPPSPLGVTWSLAVEEQFYLLWPFLLPLLIRSGHPGKLLILLWLVMTMVRQAVMLKTMGSAMDIRWTYEPFHVHCSGLLLGSALAFAPRLPKLGWIGAVLILVSAVSLNGRDVVGYAITVAEVGAALVIGEVAQPSRLASLLAWEPLRLLGLISYGVYLWHAPVLAAIGGAGWPLFLAGSAASMSLAWLSYSTIEVAFRRRRLRERPATS